MKELRDHPFVISAILIITSVGITWSVAKELMVEPRNFEIENLRNDNSALKSVVSPNLISNTEATARKIPPVDATNSGVSAGASSARENDYKNSVSFIDFLKKWKDEGLTDLQRTIIEEGFHGQQVQWSGFVRSVGTVGGSDDIPYIIFSAEEDGWDTAFCSFETVAPRELSKYNKGQKLKFAGTVDRFFSGPMLSSCSIVEVLSNDT